MMQRCSQDETLKTIDSNEAMDMAEFFSMFADSGRIKLLMLLDGREVCVNHIAQAMDMSISAVSHQLRLLRQQRLVRFVREGRNIYYTLDDEHVSSVISTAHTHLEHRKE